MQKTETMKIMLVLLTLLFVFTVEGMEQGGKQRDPCVYAEDAVEHFAGMRACEDGLHYWGIDMALLRSAAGNITVDELRHVFTNHCSTVFPAMVQCFRGFVQQSCPADQKTYLTSVLDNTGFACQPSSSSVHPHILHLLSRLSDADLVVNRSCRGDFTVGAHKACTTAAEEATGLSKSEFQQLQINGSVQQALPIVPLYMNKLFECMVSKVRDNAGKCPQWRGQVLRLALSGMMPPNLGRTMTFTQQQMDQLFAFEDAEAKRSADSGQSPFSGQ